MTLAKLLAETEERSKLLREAAEDARPACVAAVRQMEASLVEALGGETLKGLPCLYGESAERFYGARARGRLDKKLYEKPVLVICPDGRLRVAQFVVAGPGVPEGVLTREAEDSELLVEDVEVVARAIDAVLKAHVAAAARTTARYDALVELAQKLEAALLP